MGYLIFAVESNEPHNSGKQLLSGKLGSLNISFLVRLE